MRALDEVRELFADPPKEFRGAPFWSWNDRLGEEELRRQVRDMAEHGMGGFFMHSRSGLETPYLSREWMDRIRATVDEAKKTGMLAWLYDEDRWPSGAAGGIVTKKHPEFRVKGMELTESPARDHVPGAPAVKVFTARRSGRELLGVQEIRRDEPDIPEEKVVLSFSVVTGNDAPWWARGAYLDVMDPEAVRAFIESTYEAYKRAVGDEFGKAVPGIFTDEPNYGCYRSDDPGKRSLPWTTRFADEFRSRFDYDILPFLPALFYDVVGWELMKIRHDYWRCCTELFVESFTKQIAEWCEESGLDLSGHMLAEESLVSQTRVIGAAMPHHEYQQQPGIDILRERNTETLTCKQASSAARQFGRKRVLSELYGCTGWDFTFEGMKWVGDWQFALGVNSRCQHLTLYSITGCRKRDYPPSFNYHSPWWKYHKVVADYFARLSVVLSEGDRVARVLVIHPIESAWAVSSSGDVSRAQKLDESFKALTTALLEAHIDFDFGDESILSRHGSVEGSRLRVARAAYDHVVLPEVLTLRKSTFELLRSFAEAGGKICAIEPLAGRLDCEESDELGSFLAAEAVRKAGDPGGIVGLLEEAGAREVSVAAGGAELGCALAQLRELDGARLLFIRSGDRENAHEAEVRLKAPGGLEEWDLMSGERLAIEHSREGEWLVAKTLFHPTGSRLLVARDDALEGPPRSVGVVKSSVRLKRTWSYERDEPNVLLLDRASYRIDKGRWSEETAVWQAERDVRRLLGLGDNSNSSTQRWKLFEVSRDTGRRVDLRFRFQMRVEPDEVDFVIEHPERWEVYVNGERVGTEPRGWYIDRRFSRLPIRSQIRRGRNEVIVSTRMYDETEIEECYLVGAFGVDHRRFAVVAEPKHLRQGSWVEQGHPFYGGSITYSQHFRLRRVERGRTFLRLTEHAATMAAVSVNGNSCGVLPWAPFELDVTEHIRDGENEIAIEVVGSRRNVLGPMHLAGGKPGWTGPGQFRTEGAERTEEYVFVPYGLLGDVVVERRA